MRDTYVIQSWASMLFHRVQKVNRAPTRRSWRWKAKSRGTQGKPRCPYHDSWHKTKEQCNIIQKRGEVMKTNNSVSARKRQYSGPRLNGWYLIIKSRPGVGELESKANFDENSPHLELNTTFRDQMVHLNIKYPQTIEIEITNQTMAKII